MPESTDTTEHIHIYKAWVEKSNSEFRRECAGRDCRSSQEFRWSMERGNNNHSLHHKFNDYIFRVATRVVFLFPDPARAQDGILPHVEFQLDVIKMKDGHAIIFHKPPEKYSMSQIMKQVWAAIESLELYEPI